jgi:hypothetical protein
MGGAYGEGNKKQIYKFYPQNFMGRRHFKTNPKDIMAGFYDCGNKFSIHKMVIS